MLGSPLEYFQQGVEVVKELRVAPALSCTACESYSAGVDPCLAPCSVVPKPSQAQASPAQAKPSLPPNGSSSSSSSGSRDVRTQNALTSKWWWWGKAPRGSRSFPGGFQEAGVPRRPKEVQGCSRRTKLEELGGAPGCSTFPPCLRSGPACKGSLVHFRVASAYEDARQREGR